MQDKIIFVLAHLVIIVFVALNSIYLLELFEKIQGNKYEDDKYMHLLKGVSVASLNVLLLYPELKLLGLILKLI